YEKAERPRCLREPTEVVHQGLELHPEQLAQSAVNIQMDARLVVGIADFLDPLRDIGREGQQLLALQPNVIFDDRKGRMRQQVDALENGAIKLQGIGLVAAGQSPYWRFRDRRTVLCST